MKQLGLSIVFLSIIALAGCSGTCRVPAAGDLASLESTDPEAAERLSGADALYRQALAHYVSDEWGEAARLLAESDAILESLRGRSGSAERARSSLHARVQYFQGMVDRQTGLDGGEAAPDARPATRYGLPPSATDHAMPVNIVTNTRVQKWLDYFQGKGRKEMTRWLTRRSKYLPLIAPILEEEGLPPELFYLAVIESGLNPRAYSHAHACGLWQFIESRAEMYDLRVDWWVDERRDPEKATRAACIYLKELYEMFGCWELALAGYNSGEGRVSRARRRDPSCKDYWCLDLPRETENFVPKFMAAVLIGTDPEAYGFSVAAGDQPTAYDRISVEGTTDVELIARAAGSSLEEIRDLNPALRRWCTPPTDDQFVVNVPRGAADRCASELAKVPPSERTTWQRHRITKGETLSQIARGYGTSVRAIMDANDIRNAHRIRSGDYLVVPIGPGGDGVYDGLDAADGLVTYHVRPGDTITKIARRYGKRTTDVLRWNGLNWNSKIFPGDTVKIHSM